MIFFMFALIGAAEIIFLLGGFSRMGIPYIVGVAAYVITLFAQLFFLAIVKDEIDKGKTS